MQTGPQRIPGSLAVTERLERPAQRLRDEEDGSEVRTRGARWAGRRKALLPCVVAASCCDAPSAASLAARLTRERVWRRTRTWTS